MTDSQDDEIFTVDDEAIERAIKAIHDPWDRKLHSVETCRPIVREVIEAIMTKQTTERDVA